MVQSHSRADAQPYSPDDLGYIFNLAGIWLYWRRRQ